MLFDLRCEMSKWGVIEKKICFEMNDHSIIIKILVCKESNHKPNVTFTVCYLSVWIGSVDIFI